MKNLIIIFLLSFGFALPAIAQQSSEEFYIQQRSTNRLGVPYYGYLQNPNTMLMHPDPATPKEKGHFFFEQKEGPWGLIVSAYDKNLCLCPVIRAGWEIKNYPGFAAAKGDQEGSYNGVFHESGKMPHLEAKPKTGTFIGYANTKTELCYWRIDQEEDVIIHLSGGYMMAQGASGEQNPSLIFEKDFSKYGNSATKFVAIETNNVQRGLPGRVLKLDLGMETQSIYQLAKSLTNNSVVKRKEEYFVKQGFSETQSNTSAAVKIPTGKLVKSLLSGANKITAIEATMNKNTKMFSKEDYEKSSYNLGPNESVAIWQESLIADFKYNKTKWVFNSSTKKYTPNEFIHPTFYDDFETENVQNEWHVGRITSDIIEKNGRNVSVLRWTNNAGKSWTLEANPQGDRKGAYVILNTDDSNPYFDKGFEYRTFKFLVDEYGQAKGFEFGSTYYKRVLE